MHAGRQSNYYTCFNVFPLAVNGLVKTLHFMFPHRLLITVKYGTIFYMLFIHII